MSSGRRSAIESHLAQRRITLLHAEPDEASGETRVSGEVWHRISVPGFEHLRDIEVALPVEGRVTVDAANEVRVTAMSEPSSEDVDEVVSFVTSLAGHGQIESVGAGSISRPTHRIETDEQGRRRLVRKGFSAL